MRKEARRSVFRQSIPAVLQEMVANALFSSVGGPQPDAWTDLDALLFVPVPDSVDTGCGHGHDRNRSRNDVFMRQDPTHIEILLTPRGGSVSSVTPWRVDHFRARK
jgi:hypothetical protein